MLLNVDALGGEIRVEVLDRTAKVLASSKPMTGDYRHGEVPWERGRLAELKDQVVTCRFTLRNARFFSYWFQN